MAKRTQDSARVAAMTLVKHGMNATKAYQELHPEVSYESATVGGSRMVKEPAVRDELEKLMSAGERDAKEFIRIQWEFLEALRAGMKTGKIERETIEVGLNANRVLAKGYIGEKAGGDTKQVPTMTFGNIDESELANLTGSVEKKNVQ